MLESKKNVDALPPDARLGCSKLAQNDSDENRAGRLGEARRARLKRREYARNARSYAWKQKTLAAIRGRVKNAQLVREIE